MPIAVVTPHFVRNVVAVVMMAALGVDSSFAQGPSALDLGGADAYVALGNPAALGLTTFTLETWFMRHGAGQAVSTGTNGVTAIPLVSKGRHQTDGSSADMNYFLGIRAADGVLAADFRRQR